MIQAIDTVYHEGDTYLSVAAYSVKYQIMKSTVHGRVRKGLIKSVKWGVMVYVLDVAPEPVRGRTRDRSEFLRADAQRCARCLEWKPYADYRQSARWHGGYCRNCMAIWQRCLNGNKVDLAIEGQEGVALAEKRMMTADQIEVRERSIAELSAHYAEIGECGDGKDWPYEEQ